MSSWKTIDSAPKDGSLFIGYLRYGTCDGEPLVTVSIARWQDGGFRFPNIRQGNPTHWMELEYPNG